MRPDLPLPMLLPRGCTVIVSRLVKREAQQAVAQNLTTYKLMLFPSPCHERYSIVGALSILSVDKGVGRMRWCTRHGTFFITHISSAATV
jgi:hypothetical protein